jgi:hypothetical protein
MKKFEQWRRQARDILDKLGIHPLALTAGAVFCLFFPRFFLLAAFGYGAYWVVRNIVLPSRRQGGAKGRNGR